MRKTKQQLSIDAFSDYPQPISVAIWRMHDTRERTLEAVTDLPEAALDWLATGLQNSIGTLLYHIAAIEMDWLYCEVLEMPDDKWPEEVTALFPYPVRDAQGRLYPVENVSFSEHVTRLDKTRQFLLDTFKSMTLEDYGRLRDLPDYDVSPEWVLHHVAQHEDEHRGEITTIRTLYEAVNATN